MANLNPFSVSFAYETINKLMGTSDELFLEFAEFNAGLSPDKPAFSHYVYGAAVYAGSITCIFRNYGVFYTALDPADELSRAARFHFEPYEYTPHCTSPLAIISPQCCKRKLHFNFPDDEKSIMDAIAEAYEYCKYYDMMRIYKSYF